MNFNKILQSLFGNKSTRDMKLIQPLVEKVKEAYPAIKALSNDELRAKTKEIQQYVQNSAKEQKDKIAELKAKIEETPIDERESIFNAIDDRMKMQEHIGMNGRLIVGYSNMEYPPVFYAYDGECPNCFDLNALPMRSYPLSIDSKGTATCAHCHRQYRLNQGGFVANNTGNHLTEYRADPPQPHGVLRVY